MDIWEYVEIVKKKWKLHVRASGLGIPLLEEILHHLNGSLNAMPGGPC